MKLNDEQRIAFSDAADPLIKWLNENCHPHVVAIVDQGGAQLYEGLASVKNDNYIED
jgi:hypothetical protein